MGPLASCRLSWALWAIAAGAIGTFSGHRRNCRLDLIGVVIAVVGLRQLLLYFPQVVWVEWTQAWETVATFSSVFCWLSVIAWGTVTIVRQGVRIRPWIAPALFGLLCVNLAAAMLQKYGVWTRWSWHETTGGLFMNATTWAAWSAISIPLLLGWRKWAVLPALAGILLSASASAWAALGAAFILSRRKLWVLAIIPAVIAVVLLQERSDLASTNASIRVTTWSAVSTAIVLNPEGIGWGFGSYQRALAPIVEGRTGMWDEPGKNIVLPHPASDVLLVVLRLGWVVIPVLAFLAFWFSRRLGRDPLSTSIAVAFILACIQTSLSIPQVGFLAWVLLCGWFIERSEHGKTTEERKGFSKEN